MKKKLVLLLSVCTLTAFAQTNNCGNVGFEDGTTSGWICKSGTYGIPSPGDCAAVANSVKVAAGNCLSSPVNTSVNNGGNNQNRQTLMSNASAVDPNTGNGPTITCVAPANLFPNNVNKYSFRLGNAAANGENGLAMAEAVRFTFTVDKSNAGLTYMYSAFLCESNPIHDEVEAPRFTIKVTQDINGTDTPIDCGFYQVDASSTGGTKNFEVGATVPLSNSTWKYTKWTKVGLDLTMYIGKVVTIEFTTADCYPKSGSSTTNGVVSCMWTPGTHSAYAYIDLYCTPIEIASPTICANAPSVELCAPAGYATYSWPANQPGIQPPLNKQCVIVLNPKAGDVYNVDMTSVASGGCKASAKLTLKGADFTVNNVSTCPGTPIKLSVKPTSGALTDYDWKWTPATNLSCTNCPEPTFTPGTTTTYTITMVDKDVANCNQVKTMTVNVGAGFTVTTAGTTICEGDEATLTASGADTYTWEPGTLTGATITVKPASTTTYTVTGKSNNAACPGDATATALVTVNLKPIITVTDQTICVGESAKLNGSITGGSTKGSWIGGNGTFTPNRNTIAASYKPTPAEETAGTVALTLESDAPAAPCVKDSKTMTITIVPAVTSNAGPDQNICEGSTVTLSGQFGGAATGGSWSGGSGTYTPANTDPNATYTPSAADIAAGKVTLKFTVTNGTNSTCPGGMDNMDIIIDKNPTVSAGADQTICIGESATLGGSIGGSATSGTWTGGTGTFSPNNTTLTAKYTPSLAEIAAGKVTLTLTTNAPGKCPAKSSQTTITINPIAIVEAGPDQKICIGGSVTLAGTVGGGAVSGSWSGGTGVYAPNSGTANAVYTPSAAEATAGKVTLTFTTNDPPGPCPAVSDMMTINIDQKPIAIAGDAGAICDGDVIQLNGKIKGAATEGTWSNGNGVFSKNNKDLTGTYKPTPQEVAAGKVKLILTTNTTGLCPVAVDSITIVINPNPIIKFAVDTPKACPPHCVDFFDSTTAVGSNIVKWEWDFGIKGTPIGTVKNPKEICYTQPGFYDVKLTATSDKGCHSTLTKKEMIETYQVPVANFTSNPNPVTIYDPTIHFFDQSTPDVKSWTWNMGDGKIISPNTKNPTHKYTVGVHGVYMVKLFVVNANGCVDSTAHPVEVLPEFTFFIPNAFTPTRADGINDTFFGKGVGIVEYHIWIFDRWGNMVFNTTEISHGWNGHANGGEDVAQQDVFVWKVQLKDIFGKKHDYIGTVTLVK
jgi:gliding motility-associated-like protein